MWTFEINKETKTARLSKDGILVSDDSYSGSFEKGGFNNPAVDTFKNIGPIPEGMWTIQGPPFTHGKHGPYVLTLVPDKETDLFGRDGFLIHGKPLPPKDIRDGSEGCICADHTTRVRIYQSGDNRLKVIYT